MITGVWMDEGDGANRLAVQLDDEALLVFDLLTYPATQTEIDHIGDGWIELAPSDDAPRPTS